MTELAREYGDGLYALAVEENTASEWLEQLSVLCACFREQKDFQRLLGNMALSREERLGILDNAMRGKIAPYLLNFLKILCEHNAIQEFEGCAAAFRERYDHDNGIIAAQVTTGAALSDAQREALLKKLADMTGKRIRLEEKVDPTVLGGAVLEMDGKRYDNSVAHRLEEIRRLIAGQA